MASYFMFALLIIFIIVYSLGISRARFVVAGDVSRLHSRPIYHGGYLAFWTCLPALILLIIWSIGANFIIDHSIRDSFSSQLSTLSKPQIEAFFRDAQTIAVGDAVGFSDALRVQAANAYQSLYRSNAFLLGTSMMIVAIIGFLYAWQRIKPTLRARHVIERLIMAFLILCSVIAIFTTLGIILSLIFESLRFFQKVSVFDFLFGLHWSPQTAIHADQVASEGEFGAIPLLAGTMLITAIAIFVAAPIGLLSAIYLSDYASRRFRSIAKPILEILAGIPTVVYGFFAALTVAPFIRNIAESIGMNASSESALAAGLVMGIMIIPFISSLSDDVINAVPQTLRDGSAGLGATKSETIRFVILPAALPGIISALILAISRAIGETMIVVMAAGLAANLTINPLEAVTTVTVQIVTLLVGDQEFDSAKTLAAFALGLMLFCVTLSLNFIALRVVQKYKEQYD